MRVAVIGAGTWGLNHVRVVASEPDCTLAAVCDPDSSALRRARDLVPGTPTFTDFERVLAQDDVDAIIIASPAATHAPLALAALKAGMHVLVEKPLAMNLADATAIAAAAQLHRRIAAVGHLMVHHPAVVRLRDLLRSGSLGELHYLHSTRVNLGRLRRDENALWSFGPHDLSMIDFLLQRRPTSVAARGQRVLQPDVEDVVFMTLRYASGEMAHVHLSWLNPRKERRITLVCSQKMVEFDDVSTDKLRIYDKGYDRAPAFTEYGEYLTLRDGDMHVPQIPMKEPLRLQLRDFLDSIRSNRRPIADVSTGVQVIATLEAAQKSLELDGIPVAIGQ